MVEDEVTPIAQEDKGALKDSPLSGLGMGQLLLEVDLKADELKKVETAKAEEAKKLEADKPKEVPKVEVPKVEPKLEVVEPGVPEKFKGKTVKEIVDAYESAERAKTVAEMEAARLRKEKETPPPPVKINSDELLEKPVETLRPLIKEEIAKADIESAVKSVLAKEESKNQEDFRKRKEVEELAKKEGVDLKALSSKIAEVIQTPELIPDEMMSNPKVNTYKVAYNIAKGMMDTKTIEQVKAQEVIDESLKVKAGLEKSGAEGERVPQGKLTPEQQTVKDILDSKDRDSFYNSLM